jgi:hypothetical protein
MKTIARHDSAMRAAFHLKVLSERCSNRTVSYRSLTSKTPTLIKPEEFPTVYNVRPYIRIRTYYTSVLVYFISISNTVHPHCTLCPTHPPTSWRLSCNYIVCAFHSRFKPDTTRTIGYAMEEGCKRGLYHLISRRYFCRSRRRHGRAVRRRRRTA